MFGCKIFYVLIKYNLTSSQQLQKKGDFWLCILIKKGKHRNVMKKQSTLLQHTQKHCGKSGKLALFAFSFIFKLAKNFYQ